VAFHAAFGLAYVGAHAAWRACAPALRALTLPLCRVSSAYLYGGKVVLLLLLTAASYALSKLVAGSRAGCATFRALQLTFRLTPLLVPQSRRALGRQLRRARVGAGASHSCARLLVVSHVVPFRRCTGGARSWSCSPHSHRSTPGAALHGARLPCVVTSPRAC
jgi:hypothetical protein